jgi:hypothetical protein
MKIDRISYSKIIPIGSYCNERIGLEASIDEGDDVETSMQKLKDLVNSLASNQIQVVESGNGELPVENRTPKEQQIANFKEAITTCTSMKALEMFKKLVDRENLPALTEAYDNKLKSFSNDRLHQN